MSLDPSDGPSRSRAIGWPSVGPLYFLVGWLIGAAWMERPGHDPPGSGKICLLEWPGSSEVPTGTQPPPNPGPQASSPGISARGSQDDSVDDPGVGECGISPWQPLALRSIPGVGRRRARQIAQGAWAASLAIHQAGLQEALQKLPGIGPVLAGRVNDWAARAVPGAYTGWESFSQRPMFAAPDDPVGLRSPSPIHLQSPP